MVIIEPFTWIKTTAFKERVQLANKLNEVISVLNQGPVNIEDIDLNVSSDGIFTFTFTLSDGTIKEMSFSMGDYITNEITSALTGYVSKTGVSTVTGDIRVPTTPANPLTIVNSVYVNDATEGVNNIVHKTGVETIPTRKFMLAPAPYVPNKVEDGLAYTVPLEFFDSSTPERIRIGAIRVIIRPDGNTSIGFGARNSDGTFDYVNLVEGRVI